MKAILVIELDDEWLDINNFNIDELLADVTLYHDLSLKRQCDYRQRIYRCFSRLKPMPQKKEVEVNEIEDLMHTEYSIEDIYTNKYVATIRLATDKLISLGWNACLKEITGETE